MRNYDEIFELEDQLCELLNRAEKILGYRSEDVNQVVEDLLSLNGDVSDTLATDIMDIEEEMIIIEDFYFDDSNLDDDPFFNLYDEDSDLFS